MIRSNISAQLSIPELFNGYAKIASTGGAMTGLTWQAGDVFLVSTTASSATITATDDLEVLITDRHTNGVCIALIYANGSTGNISIGGGGTTSGIIQFRKS